MKKIFLLLIVLISFSFCVKAQNQWYVAPMNRLAITLDTKYDTKTGSFQRNTGKALGVTISRYIDYDIHLGFQGAYFFMSNRQVWVSTSVIGSVETQSYLFYSDNIYEITSFGVGIMSLASRHDKGVKRFTDIIIPINYVLEYRLTDRLSAGYELACVLNLNNFRRRSTLSLGIVVGVRF